MVHLYFIEQNFIKILYFVNQLGKENLLSVVLVNKSWDNANAWTLYRIGDAYSNTGNIKDAYSFYLKANKLAPFNPEFKNKLGSSLMAQNKVQEAIVIFLSILEDNPKFLQALNNLGYANLLIGKSAESELFYKKALSLDPDYEPLLMNVVGFYIYKKRYLDAKSLLIKLLKKNPANKQAKRILEQLKKN